MAKSEETTFSTASSCEESRYDYFSQRHQDLIGSYEHEVSPEVLENEGYLISMGVEEDTIHKLHVKYDQVKYGFLDSEGFLRSVQDDWHYYCEMFEMEEDENGLHPWRGFYGGTVRGWFKEMLKVNPVELYIGMPVTVYADGGRYDGSIESIERYKNCKRDEGGHYIPKRIGVYVEEFNGVMYFKRRKNEWISEEEKGMVLGIGYWDR